MFSLSSFSRRLRALTRSCSRPRTARSFTAITTLSSPTWRDHKKFWVDTLGGVAVTIGTQNREIVKFPNALLFMNPGMPTGGSRGSTVNHIGFSVPNLRQTVDKLKAGGYKMVTAAEAPPTVKVQDDIGLTSGGDVSGIAYVIGPDDIKVEILEIKKQTMPIVSHHVHFFSQKPEEVQAWYVKIFGSKPRAAATNGIIGSDLPGIGLSFSPSPTPVVGTRGRVIDHIGFEVKGLEEFVKKLEAQGIKLDRPVHAGAGARHLDRVHHRSVGNLHRAHGGTRQGFLRQCGRIIERRRFSRRAAGRPVIAPRPSIYPGG